MIRDDSLVNAKLTYTIQEVCSATGIGRTSIYELISTGALKSFKAAGRRLIRKTDLEAYLNACCDGLPQNNAGEQLGLENQSTNKISTSPSR